MSFFDDVDGLLDDARAEAEELSDATTWAPEVGDRIQGVLTRADVVSGNYGPQVVLNVKALKATGEIEEGATATVWCGAKMLERQIVDKMPAMGKGIVVEYEGLQDTKDGSNQYKVFTVVVEAQDPAFWQDLLARKPLDKKEARAARSTSKSEGSYF